MPEVTDRAVPETAAPAAGLPGYVDAALDRLAIRPADPVPREDLARWYRAMRLARTFEQKLAALYRQGKIVGAVYLGMGQEAIATGVVSLLRQGRLFLDRRPRSRRLVHARRRAAARARALAGQGHPAVARPRARAVPRRSRAATASRRITTDRWRRGFRRARASRWRSSTASEPRVYAALTGDGATSPGDFYEGLNFAAIHKLPLVVIVENNCFAYSTPTNLQMPVANVADRAPAFNIPAGDRLRQRHLRSPAAGAQGDRSRAQRSGARIWSSSRPSDSAATASTTTWRYVPRESARVLGAPRSGAAAAGVSARRGRLMPAADVEQHRRRVRGGHRGARSPRPRRCRMPIRRSVTERLFAELSVAVATYLEAISQALREEMRRDPDVILLGEDIATFGGAFKITRGFLEEFGAERVIDTPISESGFVGAACGAAIEGLRPVVEFQFADFIACAFDQIVNYAAKALLPLGHAGAGRVSRPVGRRLPRRPVSFAESRGVVHARAGPEGGAAVDAVRRQGAAEGRDSRQQPGHLFRAQAPVSPHSRGRARGRLHRADRRRRHQARRAAT